MKDRQLCAVKSLLARIKRNSATIMMILLFVIIAGFIIHLVAQVTRFSKEVTDFYAPTIHDVKSFADGY